LDSRLKEEAKAVEEKRKALEKRKMKERIAWKRDEIGKRKMAVQEQMQHV
ncbi:hypothetical protein TNCT_204561, partial [Trichonephila clavata]